MKIISDRDVLVENVDLALKAVSNKSTLQILECLLLVVDDDGARFIGNDLSLGIETSNFAAEIIEKGSVALDAKMLSDIIRRLPAGNVTISVDGSFLTLIKSGRAEFKILGQNGEAFEFLPKIEKKERIVLPALTFKNMIRQTIFSVSADDSKPVMNGELMELNNGLLKLAATDGFRVAVREAVIFALQDEENGEKPENDVDKKFKVVIPAKTLNEISRILPNKGEVSIYLTDKHVLFELEGCIVVSRLIEGEFLNFENIFLQEYTTIINVDKGAFAECVERASLISREVKKSPVKLAVGVDKISVTSFTDMGTVYDEVSADVDGLPIEIAFSPRFLIEALKVIDETVVTLQFTTPLSPCVIKSDENLEFRYLVVPLRIRN